MIPLPPRSSLFPYTTLFRSDPTARFYVLRDRVALTGKDIKDPTQNFNQFNQPDVEFRFTNAGKTAFHDVTRTISQRGLNLRLDRKSTRLNSSHPSSSYAVFC